MHGGQTNTVDMRGASPQGDAVGRDKVTNNHYSQRRSQIDGWLDKLAAELRDDVKVQNFVDSLQYYFQEMPYDDVIGLEAKLDKSGRSDQKISALRKKEAFSKLLAEWQAYPAAQEIIAYFLAKVESAFENSVRPILASACVSEIDEAVTREMIEPVLTEMGCGPFMLNHNNVAGMVYWLAEQCYVRWHQ
ncbi:MAG: hypothetical protein IPM41_08700 [Sphingomonadales bacterium]|nr:hypothetical protein [Sphingomonadales bacterium]